MIPNYDITEFQGQNARDQHDAIVRIASRVFAEFTENYIQERLPHVVDPLLLVAQEGGRWLGFKLGYRRGAMFYSWVGGVHPEAQRRGIAQALMERQHELVRRLGYDWLMTRTRAVNNAMIILNLRNGFHISGFEVDRQGIPVVVQCKQLRERPA